MTKSTTQRAAAAKQQEQPTDLKMETECMQPPCASSLKRVRDEEEEEKIIKKEKSLARVEWKNWLTNTRPICPKPAKTDEPEAKDKVRSLSVSLSRVPTSLTPSPHLSPTHPKKEKINPQEGKDLYF